MSSSVHVSSIGPSTTKDHLHDFFTFCGKITSIDYDEKAHSATIHFEKSQAAKTALMLNGGTLDGTQLSVTSHHDGHSASGESKQEGHHEEGTFDQSDKPRAGIAAEYLARGYSLSDQILQRAIELDNQHGISTRFISYIQNLDTTVGAKALGPNKTISGKVQESLQQAHTRARSVDEQKGYSKTASDYYSKALSSPFGQKVKFFYTTTSKQILDIHEEARHLADLHKQQPAHAHHTPSPPHEATPSSSNTGPSDPPVNLDVKDSSAAAPAAGV